MSGRLSGKVAVVTGGAGGFGKAIATTFQKEGAKVVITDLSEDLGNAAAKEIGATFISADVTKKEDWEKVLKQTVDSFGSLDIVVNNAGTTYANKVSSIPPAKASTDQVTSQRKHSSRMITISVSTSMSSQFFGPPT